jgi:ActR/RegA family two-component response regulator
MRQDNEGPFKQTFSLDNHTGRFLKEELERVPLFDATRRFSCVFLSTSAKDAARLNHHLLAAGIRAYHSADTREAAVLSTITGARILLVDIDHTFEPWLEFLQRLDEAHPNLPKVVLTGRHENTWSLILSDFALDVVPKPAHLGDLLSALEHAHLVEQEINDPVRVRERELRVMAAIRNASQPQTLKLLHPRPGKPVVSIQRSAWHSIRVRLSAMMDKVTHVWWRLGCYRPPKQHSHA